VADHDDLGEMNLADLKAEHARLADELARPGPSRDEVMNDPDRAVRHFARAVWIGARMVTICSGTG